MGEWIDRSSGVLEVRCDDGTVKEINFDDENISVCNFTSDEPGRYTLKVKYTEGSFNCETTYEITVTE